MKAKILTGLLVVCSALSLSMNPFNNIVLAANEQKAVYQMEDADLVASQFNFEYYPESLYNINCQVGYITDIALKPGDVVTHIAAGDTAQWMVDSATLGNVTHVYVKPLVKDIDTNFIITTNKHVYRLELTSSDFYIPIVKWRFSKEEAELAATIKKAKENRNNSNNDTKVKFAKLRVHNYAYEIKKKKHIEPDFCPTAIYDDGVRTYIRMPKSNKYDLPVLYTVDRENKMTLVNYRVKDNVFIADRCFTHARLVFGKKMSLDFVPIKKGGDDK